MECTQMEPKKHEPKLKLVCNFRFFFFSRSQRSYFRRAIGNAREMMLISRFVLLTTNNALLLSALTFAAIFV